MKEAGFRTYSWGGIPVIRGSELEGTYIVTPDPEKFMLQGYKLETNRMFEGNRLWYQQLWNRLTGYWRMFVYCLKQKDKK